LTSHVEGGELDADLVLPLTVEQFTAELHGLNLLRQRTLVATPRPIAAGVVRLEAGALLLLEAISEVPSAARSVNQWRSIGHALAMVHQAHDRPVEAGQPPGGRRRVGRLLR
jgi:fructosamine-3-kinase